MPESPSKKRDGSSGDDGDEFYHDGAPPSPIKIVAMNDDDYLPPMPPESRTNTGIADGEFDDQADSIDRLPDFADGKAKQLHSEIKQHKSYVGVVGKELFDTKQRLAIMEEHLKNVGQEVKHASELISAKKREIETEDHLTQLVAREASRYQQEFKRMQEANESAEEKLNVAQNSIFKGNERIDQFKLEMNWNQEELEQWALAAKQKEDDNVALQKFTRADEAKIKEISLLMEKLTQVVAEAKVKVENETTETLARQIELDRTAEEFRAVHAERQTLVQQWQDTIEAIRRRDGTVQDLALSYAEERKFQAEQLSALTAKREHLDGLTSVNEELENKAQALERMVQKRREELAFSSVKLQDFTDELDLVKIELQVSASALLKRRNENTGAQRLLEDKKVVLADARRAYQDSKTNLDEEAAATSKTEISAKEAERKLADAETDLRRRSAQVLAMKEVTFKQSQALYLRRQEEANLISEISGAQSTARQLQGKIRSLDQESTRQQQLIYNAEFQIQQMERKVSRGLGERSDEETKTLKKEIAVLEGELDASREQRKMLQAQCRKLNFELRGAQRRKEVASKGAADLKSMIDELELENLSYFQNLESLTKTKEESMIQHDALRLDLKRLRDTLNTKADRVYTLENRKQQLALSMEERKHEISVHQEVQRTQVRVAEEEKHRITIELGGRRSAVEKLRDKYETLCKVSGVRSEDGESRSQAYYLIQAAQKREELQRHGDEMDQGIRKAEKEIKALAHTLQHLSAQNSNFRSAHQRVELSVEDSERMRQLEDQGKEASETLFKKKKELQRLQTDLEEDGRRLEQVVVQASRIEERSRNLEAARAQLQSELETQREAVSKVVRRAGRLSETHREKLGCASMTTQEQFFVAEATNERVVNVLFTLGQLAREYPEVKDALDILVKEAALLIPTSIFRNDDDAPPLSSRSEA